MINLKGVPFCLSDEDCEWVRAIIANMSDEEKIGQLFFGISASYDEKYLTELTSKYHLGGCRYNTAPGAVIRKHNEILQQSSKIPLFIACNTESGGSDACSDGTFIGSGIKIGATADKKCAYSLGKSANSEAAAIGCNMAFAPVCDISYNWENTEIISRAFGNDPRYVEKMSVEYLKGAHTVEGFACAAKHFPGNGLDFRDAHMSNNVNSCSIRKWDSTYGKVYKALFKNGLEAVMAGHIMLPEYSKAINRKLKDEDILPATLSKEIITGLLRERLGFNGLVITDATHMVGMTCRMKRSEMLPNVSFFSMSGSEFVEMFAGMGAAKVRDLFKQAKEKAPCIIFIDEIDAIGQKRSSGKLGGNDEREQTLNQLLTEMDGFEGNSGVIILAATNRPETLDAALTRPGRFDRRIPVELPDLKGREEILKVHAKKIKVAGDVDFSKIARMASGASGAELANIVNEAALRAVRNGRKSATQADMEESIEVVIAGYQKKNAILTDKEKLVVSYHEIGHALVAAKQTNSAPVQKITIVPRTSGALGYTMQVDEGNHYLMTKEELETKIATYTGGRVAEEVVFDSISTGASNDIEQATKIARAMITQYGMSDEFDMVALETVSNQYLGGDTALACSAELQSKIDCKVIELVKTQHEKAKRILTDNREKLDELARYLYERETITGDEFMEILNQ